MRSLMLILLSILIFGLGDTPANSQNSPFAEITVNGSNEAITIDKNDSLSVLSTFLCEFLIGQFFEEWQVVIHFSYWV
ncbi:MAG: hypothetical protein AVO38_02650 [delta proteobacterium ML8_D]|nr:MAG: hypothetical protein AVO38_02650 [delta proteobacterium ML8_D]